MLIRTASQTKLYIPSTINNNFLHNAFIIDFSCNKIWNCSLSQWFFLSFFMFLGCKYILNWKSRLLYCLRFYLMYKLICQKPDHFFSAVAVLSNFLQVFILLKMHNFDLQLKIAMKHVLSIREINIRNAA